MGTELMGEVEPAKAKTRQPRPWRLRDRVFVVLTANVAWVGAWATPWLIEQSQILEVNSARAFLLMLTPVEQSGGAGRQSAPPPLKGMSHFNPPLEGMSHPTPPPKEMGHPATSPRRGNDPGAVAVRELRKLVERQIPAVEFIVFVWKRVMWGTAGLVGLAALLAAITGWSRFFHLLVAVAILLSTAATLTAMQLLIHPDYGGMEPLPIRSHVYVGLCQSAYAWTLLLAFARRGLRPQPR